MTTTDYNPVYNSRPITTQIDYDLKKILGRYRIDYSEISVVVVIDRYQ